MQIATFFVPAPWNLVHQQRVYHKLRGGRTSLGDTSHRVLCECSPIARFLKRWDGEVGSKIASDPKVLKVAAKFVRLFDVWRKVILERLVGSLKLNVILLMA